MIEGLIQKPELIPLTEVTKDNVKTIRVGENFFDLSRLGLVGEYTRVEATDKCPRLYYRWNYCQGEWEIYATESDLIGFNLGSVGELVTSVTDLKDRMRVVEEYLGPRLKDLNITRLHDYLYTIDYTKYEYDYLLGAEYFKETKPKSMSCSTVRNGEFIGRNLDLTYSEDAEFLVITPARNGRHATIGLAFNGELTDAIVKSGKYSNAYAVLPFSTVDGINDASVYCSANMNDSDLGRTTGTDSTKEDLTMTMVVRYILDYANDANHALELLRNRNMLAIFSSTYDSEYHFLICDPTHTYIVEFVHNEMVVLEGKDIMTNFHLYNTVENPDGTINRDSLVSHAVGIERYNLLRTNLQSATSLGTMLAVMDVVKYSQTYEMNTNPLWYSECYGVFPGYGDVNKDTPNEQVLPMLQKLNQRYQRRSRNPESQYYGTWHTQHSTAYNILEKCMMVKSQEWSDTYYFELGGVGPTEEPTETPTLPPPIPPVISTYIDRDPMHIGGDDLCKSLTLRTMTLRGKIEYYQESPITPVEGNYVGCMIVPPAEYLELYKDTVVVTYKGMKYDASVFKRGRLILFINIRVPGQEVPIRIDWNDEFKEDFMVRITPDSILEDETINNDN